MKGRRKVKTLKWQMKAKFEAEARAALRNRPVRQESFLDLALKEENDLEPVGLLAGRAKNPCYVKDGKLKGINRDL
ncbi:hypothetical protein BVY11_27915 [Pseudomonas amygdali pv. morsprunorum]|uniref:Uncharacterized protein n=1 Tax=Pseudomonas syringae pv. philadelphi TaxID=251706 RepID=A0A3M3ZVJ3_9PSED|nr:hypothetical protein BVY11_27915 [Pseudomonas amygdali pv. morsprunorum]PPS24981.1 hypothetical protein BVY12_29385 [Pseudomonas amygdali pv. morsprunorum]RMO98125.1 hypothetical protein ALQ33_102136 [Pseudomonas syringae pv. philadelphi]